MPQPTSRKDLGSYYTPPEVVRGLVSWATRGQPGGPVLDPSCGDGRFLAGLRGRRRRGTSTPWRPRWPPGAWTPKW